MGFPLTSIGASPCPTASPTWYLPPCWLVELLLPNPDSAATDLDATSPSLTRSWLARRCSPLTWISMATTPAVDWSARTPSAARITRARHGSMARHLESPTVERVFPVGDGLLTRFAEHLAVVRGECSLSAH